MVDRKRTRFDLGKSGAVTGHMSEDGKRLLIDFDVDKKGFTKTVGTVL
jgi:hypothetical protein